MESHLDLLKELGWSEQEYERGHKDGVSPPSELPKLVRQPLTRLADLMRRVDQEARLHTAAVLSTDDDEDDFFHLRMKAHHHYRSHGHDF